MNDFEKFCKLFLLSNTITFKNEKGEEQSVLALETVDALLTKMGVKIAMLRSALTHIHSNVSDSDKLYIESMLGTTAFDKDLEAGVSIAVGDVVEVIDTHGEVISTCTVEGNTDFLFIRLPEGDTYMVGIYGLMLDLPNIRKKQL